MIEMAAEGFGIEPLQLLHRRYLPDAAHAGTSSYWPANTGQEISAALPQCIRFSCDFKVEAADTERG